MARVVVSEFVSLDGVFEDPGGAEQHPVGGWAFKFDRSDEGNSFKLEELRSAEALLLGRKTYEGFAAAWPGRDDDEFGAKMNQMPKYVYSSTLHDPQWQNTTVFDRDLAGRVAELKEELTGDILVLGSGQLVMELIGQGLLDECRLMVFPIVLGRGRRLFEEAEEPRKLRLRDSQRAGETLIVWLEAS